MVASDGFSGFERVLDNANPDLLMRSAFIVLARYQREGKEPGADRWLMDTRRYRRELIEDILVEWSTVAGTDEFFPWHDDWIAWMFGKVRRLHNAKKVEYCELFNIAIPDKWQERDAA